MSRIEYYLNVMIALIIGLVILAAFGVQFFLNEQPCPLCFLQRVAMLGVATGAIMNLQFGIRMAHHGLILLSSLVGGFIALRQIALHVCPGNPTFGIPVLSLSLYTWSFIIFVCTAVWVTISLFLYNPDKSEPYPFDKIARGTIGLVVLIAIGNIISSLYLCGLGSCPE